MLASFIAGSWVWMAAIAGPTPFADTHLVDEAGLRRAGLTVYWEANLPLAPRDRVRDTVLVEDTLYVMTGGGTVFALHADAGLIRWGAKLSDPDYMIYRPGHIRAGDDVALAVIPTTNRLYIMDRHSGEIIHSFVPSIAPGSAAVGLGQTIFMGSADGSFYALLWGSTCMTRPLKQWQVVTNGPVTASPSLYDEESLIFASHGGTVYSCRAWDKTYKWSFNTGGAVLGDPAVDAGSVYVANLERSVFKLDADTGELVWRRRLPCPIEEGPIVTSGTVYQHCPGYGLVAIDATLGTEKWRHAGGRTLAAHMGQRDVVFTDQRRLDILDHDTGRSLATVDTYDAELAVANGLSDAVYLLERSGRVLCLRPEGVPYLRPVAVNIIRAGLSAPPPKGPVTAPGQNESPEESANPLANDPLRSRRDVGP